MGVPCTILLSITNVQSFVSCPKERRSDRPISSLDLGLEWTFSLDRSSYL